MIVDSPTQYTILYSTQSNRSKSCARRTFRILQSLQKQSHINYFTNCFYSTFDGYGVLNFFELGSEPQLLIAFLSTYGQGEHCYTIKRTWNALLQKSIPKFQFIDLSLALFGLGDIRYEGDYNAAVKKFAARMIQLGSKLLCKIGYGNDSNGQVLADLDNWLWNILVPKLNCNSNSFNLNDLSHIQIDFNYLYLLKKSEIVLRSHRANLIRKNEHMWKTNQFKNSYMLFFLSLTPSRVYSYPNSSKISEICTRNLPLTAKVKKNIRLTQEKWFQNTRHLTLSIDTCDMNTEVQQHYYPGDIVAILPSNPHSLISRFLMVLPKNISSKFNEPLHLSCKVKDEILNNKFIVKWPSYTTLKGILTYCMDISSQPEREDLHFLSGYCCLDHPEGRNQSLKLLELSGPRGNDLYIDYILREKRNWADIFYDFDSLHHPNSHLTTEDLLCILPPLKPRQYSIASSPSELYFYSSCLTIDLCVTIVEGKTPLQNHYQGLCSCYLRDLKDNDSILIWIQQGSFPHNNQESITTPTLFVGSGTGIAPIRSIIREKLWVIPEIFLNDRTKVDAHTLIFGCRNSNQDYYYQYEWQEIIESTSHQYELHILAAFSRDINYSKKYVQTILVECDNVALLIRHIQKGGLIYISGNANMVKDIEEEIINCLSRVMSGRVDDAKKYVRKMQISKKICVEAWL